MKWKHRVYGFLLSVCLIMSLGCVSRMQSSVGKLSSAVESKVHEWRGFDFTVENGPPLKKELVVGFITVGGEMNWAANRENKWLTFGYAVGPIGKLASPK